MSTLEEAWKWYEDTRRNLGLFRRLTRPDYWCNLPLERDDRFKSLDPGVVTSEITTGLLWFDDVAVVAIFFAFESLVRE